MIRGLQLKNSLSAGRPPLLVRRRSPNRSNRPPSETRTGPESGRVLVTAPYDTAKSFRLPAVRRAFLRRVVSRHALHPLRDLKTGLPAPAH